LRAIAPDVSQATATVLERMIAPDPLNVFRLTTSWCQKWSMRSTLSGSGTRPVARGRSPRWALAVSFYSSCSWRWQPSFCSQPERACCVRGIASASVASVKLNGKDKSPADRGVNPQPAGVASRAEDKKKVLAFEIAHGNSARQLQRADRAL